MVSVIVNVFRRLQSVGNLSRVFESKHRFRTLSAIVSDGLGEML